MSEDHKHGVIGSRNLWTHDETRILLKSWKDHFYIKRLLKKSSSKQPFYFAISKDLKKCGFNRSVKEIEVKIRNLRRSLKTSTGPHDFIFYNEVVQLLKMEQGIVIKENTEPQIIHETDKPQIVLDESYIEGINSENVQVIRLSVPDHQDVSNSSPPSYTEINHSEPEVPNEFEEIETTQPQSSSSNSQETQENILLSFYQEFERSNRQLEKNDAAMLELFKEQNDIFRTQTTLLMKILLK